MSYAPRPGSSALNRPSSSQSTQASLLATRIQEKRAELESLKQLRDLSAGLAGQMQQLEEKLGTLSNGTEAVAAVMGNWNTVLRAVYMASASIPKPNEQQSSQEEEEPQLPQTLVRIPIQQAEAAQREMEGKEAASGGG